MSFRKDEFSCSLISATSDTTSIPSPFFTATTATDKLQMVMAEVNNTFGETANYWLTPTVERPAGENKRYRFPKTFHVSPFLKLGQEYDWTFTPPGERLISQSVSYENGREIFDSTLKLERREWSRAELHRALLRFPWMTAKVITAIHWQALRLLLKRVPGGQASRRRPFRAGNSSAFGGVMASGITTNIAKKIFLKTLAGLRVG